MLRTILALTILTATNLNAQWQLQDAHTTADLRGIDNVGGGFAWASGSDGTILRTEDGGIVWQLCAKPPGGEHLDFRAIQAFDNNTAIIMSSGKGDLSRLYKTTDGCQTWKLLFTNPDKDGFWDALIMTGPEAGMLIGDPIAASTRSGGSAQRRSIFPTFHTTNGGRTWKRNDNGILAAQTDQQGEPKESIFAASNSSMILLPYLTLFVTGGAVSALHYRQYTLEHVNGLCDGRSICEMATETPLHLREGPSAGGFSLAANWSLDPESVDSHASQPRLRTRVPGPHVVVIVGGDYTQPDEQKGTASVCTPTKYGTSTIFSCAAATTLPHGYRSAVAYDDATDSWITVGPNGTDISTDNGRNWRALESSAAFNDARDADQHWNALSLPYAVGPRGRIGKLRPSALQSAK